MKAGLDLGDREEHFMKWRLSKLEEVMKRQCLMGKGLFLELRAEGLQVKTAFQK